MAAKTENGGDVSQIRDKINNTQKKKEKLNFKRKLSFFFFFCCCSVSILRSLYNPKFDYSIVFNRFCGSYRGSKIPTEN